MRDGFTRFGSLNHVTDLEATIDQSWNVAGENCGDDIQLKSFSGIDGAPENGGGAPDHPPREVPHTVGPRSPRPRPVPGKIHVRTDVEVEVSSVISILSDQLLTVDSRTM